MGIHGLTKLIADKAPGAIKEHKMDSYFGRKIAVDASMSIYQFLIAVRQGEQGQGRVDRRTGQGDPQLLVRARRLAGQRRDAAEGYLFNHHGPGLDGRRRARVVAARRHRLGPCGNQHFTVPSRRLLRHRRGVCSIAWRCGRHRAT